VKGINDYWEQLSEEEIAVGKHREFVGGMWDDIGRLQLEFLQQQGLQPEHRLVDVGCGALRGGIHLAAYLDPGNYFGLDVNPSLIEAGRRELAQAGLQQKAAHLAVSDTFELGCFGANFDFGIAVSLFTHLPMNHIIRCLVEVRRTLAPGGKFYATFLEAPISGHLEPIRHEPGGITTLPDQDPFHYSVNDMQAMAGLAGLSLQYIGEWGHPRSQKMLCFYQPDRKLDVGSGQAAQEKAR
jgi:SAM-dependent methyltransferase